jgi:hypothetical protein
VPEHRVDCAINRSARSRAEFVDAARVGQVVAAQLDDF